MIRPSLCVVCFLLLILPARAKEQKFSNSRYTVYGPEEKAKKVLGYLEKFHREAKKIYPWIPGRSKKFLVYLIVDQKEFGRKKRGSSIKKCQSSLACITTGNHVISYFGPPRWQVSSNLFHYSAHQFFQKAFSPRPLWLEEGFAEYFGGSIVHFDRDSIDFGLVRYKYLSVLKHSLDKGEFPVLEEFFDLSPSAFYQPSKVKLHRALSWLLVHYLIKKKKKILQKIFRFLRRQRPLYYQQILGGFSPFRIGLKKHLKKLSKKLGEEDFKKALEYFKGKKYWESLKACSRVLKSNPYHTNARYIRALCQIYRHNEPAALKDFQFLIDIGLDQWQPYYYCAQIHLKRGYRPQALGFIQKASSLAPKNAKVARLLKKIKNNR